MDYNDSFEKAGECLRLALKYLTEYRLSPTPANYAVFYDYAAGRSKALTTEINLRLKEKKAITQDCCSDWFRQHIGEESLKSKKIMNDFRKILADMVHFLSQSGDIFPNHNERFREYTESLSNMEGTDEARNILQEIIQETRSVSASTSVVSERFDNVHREITNLREQLRATRMEADTDPLTGLINRRGMEKALGGAILDTEQDGTPLSLIIVDIDFFKKINDTHGHLVGDSVLKIVSNTIRDCIKGKDTAARYGGEEFVVILPETSLKGSIAVAESIRKTIEKMRWKNKETGARIGQLTVSGGISLYQKNESGEDLIKRADEALYHSKNNGRNRITTEGFNSPSKK